MGIGLKTLGLKNKWTLYSPLQQKFSPSKMKTYQENRCGCDFLISSSNSQVELPVLRPIWLWLDWLVFPNVPQLDYPLKQHVVLPLWDPPWSVHPWLQAHEMGQRFTSSTVTRGIPDGDLLTEGAKQSYKPPAQSSSKSGKDQGT